MFFVNIGINGPGDIGEWPLLCTRSHADVLTAPPNMSHPVVKAFQIDGPSNDAFEGTICLPQVPLPENISFQIGDNITIQVIELAQHGAAIYNVSPLSDCHLRISY
jgi:hypothetical protein